MTSTPLSLDVERAVRERYSAAAGEREASLCCPVEYDPRYLEAIPREVLERDYGCGDPSRYARPGDAALDLGSGSGKSCFVVSQIVGAGGRVIGIDANEEMLALARGAAPAVADAVGFSNVEFRRARIQDLALDLEQLDAWLRRRPVRAAADLEAEAARLRREEPLVPDGAIDIAISNCVLNLVHPEDRRRLIAEIFRVLRADGRIAISDIVSDEPVPEDLKRDPVLWSGCISGAFEEGELLRELERAGFYGIAIEAFSEEPFQVVRGIEFRSVTVTARKGKEGPCYEEKHAVMYRGPWKQVKDDDGHVLRRGERTAVCAKTYRLLTSSPYAAQVIPIPPRVAASEREPFDCSRSAPRHARETKGEDYDATREASACGPEGCC